MSVRYEDIPVKSRRLPDGRKCKPIRKRSPRKAIRDSFGRTCYRSLPSYYTVVLESNAMTYTRHFSIHPDEKATSHEQRQP